MLRRILFAAGLAAAVVSATAVAFLRTDFVANNLCAYAVATIEEATAAQVKVASCSVEPEKGKLTIEFAITKTGELAGMKLIFTSGDVALDRAAWGSITNSHPFPPLPTDFKGDYLGLRFRYYYNYEDNELD